jgi:glycosyltransferase involved in cell wall biosynthesis
MLADTVLDRGSGSKMQQNTRRIVFSTYSGTRLHTLWKNFLSSPPEGFSYSFLDDQITRPPPQNGEDSIRSLLYKIKRRVVLLDLAYKHLTERRRSMLAERSGASLYYCINGMVSASDKIPWVVDFENPLVFTNFHWARSGPYRSWLISRLNSPSCRAIIAYSEVGARGMLELYPEIEKEKVVIVPNCVREPQKPERFDHREMTLLFTGSTNVPDNFDMRGGVLLARAFQIVRSRLPEARLVMRCGVPEKYSWVREIEGIDIIEAPLDREAFSALFERARAYVLPAFGGFALSTLEAMSYGLPVITSDVLENKEHVIHDQTGFNVNLHGIKWLLPSIPEYYAYATRLGTYSYPEHEQTVAKLAEYMISILTDDALHKRLSHNARNHVSRWFSIRHKNERLAQLFDSSIEGTPFDSSLYSLYSPDAHRRTGDDR